jgi:hypothetical protein
VKTETNKRLLISESHGDSNRCTPCRGKLDQYDTYASHASPRTPSICFLRAVPKRGNLPRATDRDGRSHCSREKGLPTQSPARRLTDPIGTFNTCSWGPTERSLTDTGGGYNLKGAGLPHTHSPTFPTSCLPFPLVAPPGLQFNQVPAFTPSIEF